MIISFLFIFFFQFKRDLNRSLTSGRNAFLLRKKYPKKSEKKFSFHQF